MSGPTEGETVSAGYHIFDNSWMDAIPAAGTSRIDALETVAKAAREVERILRQSGVTDSRIADLRAALRALSSEDAT